MCSTKIAWQRVHHYYYYFSISNACCLVQRFVRNYNVNESSDSQREPGASANTIRKCHATSHRVETCMRTSCKINDMPTRCVHECKQWLTESKYFACDLWPINTHWIFRLVTPVGDKLWHAHAIIFGQFGHKHCQRWSCFSGWMFWLSECQVCYTPSHAHKSIRSFRWKIVDSLQLLHWQCVRRKLWCEKCRIAERHWWVQQNAKTFWPDRDTKPKNSDEEID